MRENKRTLKEIKKKKKKSKEHTKKMYNIKNYDKMEMIQETKQLKKKYFLRTHKTK